MNTHIGLLRSPKIRANPVALGAPRTAFGDAATRDLPQFRLYPGREALVIMTPRPTDSSKQVRGWRANDMTPEMIWPYRARFHTYYTAGSSEDCWQWRGYHHKSGYPRFSRSSKLRPSGWYAHRMAWVFANVAALTDDLTIDHLCHVQNCVNPAHLAVVSMPENAGGRTPTSRRRLPVA